MENLDALYQVMRSSGNGIGSPSLNLFIECEMCTWDKRDQSIVSLVESPHPAALPQHIPHQQGQTKSYFKIKDPTYLVKGTDLIKYVLNILFVPIVGGGAGGIGGGGGSHYPTSFTMDDYVYQLESLVLPPFGSRTILILSRARTPEYLSM